MTTTVEPTTTPPAGDSPPSPAGGPLALVQGEDRPADMGRGVLLDASIDARIRYARELAHAGLLPAAFRKQPANVLYAVEYGNMLGIHPLAAITGVHVMDGKPTASSALMGALVRKAGHRLRVRVTGTVRAGDLTAIAEITRSDDPEFTYSASWDLDRAHRAGLIDSLNIDESGRTIVRARTQGGKPSNWEKFPEAMVKARAISEVAREACEEALCGVNYTPEELGAVVDEDENVVVGEQLAERSSFEPTDAPTVDWVTLAQDAADVGTVRDLWRQARDAGAFAGPDGESLSSRLAEIATSKQAEADGATPPADSPDDGIVDADIVEDGEQPTLPVEDPPGCDVRGCSDPTSHDRDGHKAFLKARSDDAPVEWPATVQPGSVAREDVK